MGWSLLSEQLEEQGFEFRSFVGWPDKAHAASVNDEIQELHANSRFLDPFVRIDAWGTSGVLGGETEHNPGCPNYHVNGGVEVPIDMGSATVVNKAGESSLWVGRLGLVDASVLRVRDSLSKRCCFLWGRLGRHNYLLGEILNHERGGVGPDAG